MVNDSITKKQAKQFTIVAICATLLFGTQLVPQATNAAGEKKFSNDQTNTAPEFQYQELKGYQPLPEFPQFTGHTEFDQGILFPNSRGGTAVTYMISAKENKEAVLQWYRDALKMYQWNLGSGTKSMIYATKGANVVQILITNPTRSGYGCTIGINYKAGRVH